MSIHHAWWSRWFKTMWYKGTFAYELQIGPLVFQWFHGHHRPPPTVRSARDLFTKGRFKLWRDSYWR